MDIDHWYQLLHGAKTDEEKHRALEIWLGLSEVVEEVIEEPSANRTEFEDDNEENTNFAASSNIPPLSEPSPTHLFQIQFPFKNEKFPQARQFSDEQQNSKSKLNSSHSDLPKECSSAERGDEKQEELIDIQGAATYEEEARMLEADIEYHQKLDVSTFANDAKLMTAHCSVLQYKKDFLMCNQTQVKRLQSESQSTSSSELPSMHI